MQSKRYLRNLGTYTYTRVYEKERRISIGIEGGKEEKMAKSGFKEYVHKVSSTSGIVPNRKEGGEGEVYYSTTVSHKYSIQSH